MKLILCRRGNVRSQTLATIMRDFYGERDVVVAGLDTFSEDLLSVFGYLADEIWVVGDALMGVRAGTVFKKEFTWIDVGDDVWGKPMHPELIDVLLAKLKEMGYNEISPNYDSVEAYRSAVRR